MPLLTLPTLQDDLFLSLTKKSRTPPTTPRSHWGKLGLTRLILYCIEWPIGNMWFQLKLQNNLCNRGLYKKSKFFWDPISPNFCARCVALWWITCQAACHGKTEHGIFVKFKKTSKTAVILIAGVTISGTPCPRHFIVPFGVEAPSGHVAQAWAIPPLSRGLLSQWHRQQTTTPETNKASSRGLN